MRRWISYLAIVGTILTWNVSDAIGQTIVDYRFDGNVNDSSGSGLHGELVGDAEIENGRLFLPGGLDNGVSIPLGDMSPFGGDRDFTVAFDFQSVDGITGALFSADGAPMCEDEDDACWEGMPRHPETGNQAGSLNIFMWGDGTVATDFWFIGAVESELQYNDDEVHSYFGSYNATSGEYTQVIDGEDSTSNVFLVAEEGPYMRDASFDRTSIGDESNSSFGFDFNFDGFNGTFDNFSIETPQGKVVDYAFEGSPNDASGGNRHGVLVGDATIEDGRLKLPGGIDNSFSIPLGEDSPFGGDTSWRIEFDFQTNGGSQGPLFSADGSLECEEGDFECEEFWPEHEENGLQAGSLNIYLGIDGELVTDFWFIGDVVSEQSYDDNETHTYVGSYNAETGEFVQTIDGGDQAFVDVLFEVEGEGDVFMRDTSGDRTLVGDESNFDFGFEFNPEGFNGYIDNLVIESGASTGLDGDFNSDGVLGVEDVNQLTAAMAAGDSPAELDLDGDGQVGPADLSIWVNELRQTWFGDANLDGEFNTADFVDVFQKGTYEADVDAGWSDGDWTGDRRFTTADLVQAFQEGGFELGPRGAQAVPEPSSLTLIGLAVLLATQFRRRFFA